jgi:outer membrane immunogenic protein
MIRKLLLGAVGALVLASASNAADMPVNRPVYKAVPAPVFNWTGFYVGGQIGGGWGDHDRDTGAFQNSYSSSGIIGGAHLGYNWQARGSSIVWGIEADINASGIKGDDNGAGGTFDESKLTWVGSIRGRLGVANNNWLFYGTAGWAFGEIRHLNPAGVPASNDSSVDGWTAGLGIEWAFAPRWTTRLEYRYYDLGDYNLAPAGLAAFTVDNTYHTVTWGVSYRF